MYRNENLAVFIPILIYNFISKLPCVLQTKGKCMALFDVNDFILKIEWSDL